MNGVNIKQLIRGFGKIYRPENKHRNKPLGKRESEANNRQKNLIEPDGPVRSGDLVTPDDLTRPGDLIKPDYLINQWIERCVIDLSLCPFASAPYRTGKVRIVTCATDSAEGFLADIKAELDRLAANSSEIETTLIAAEIALTDFLDFNEFLTSVEALLQVDNLEEDFQMASFHPHYRFAGVDEDDAGNYTNRAPYPIVQWLRTDTVARAAAAMDTLAIPDANIEKLKNLESEKLRGLFPWVK